MTGRPNRTPCPHCKRLTVTIECFDSRRRRFESAPSSDPETPDTERWVRLRSRNMRMCRGSDLAVTPPVFLTLHRCAEYLDQRAERHLGRVDPRDLLPAWRPAPRPEDR